MTCACGVEAVGVCSWRCLKWKIIPVLELVVGEQIRRWNEEKPRSGKVAKVTAIIKTSTMVIVKFAIFPVDPKGRITYRQQFLEYAKAVRQGECGEPVCEACGIDRGRRICKAHWSAWERIA